MCTKGIIAYENGNGSQTKFFDYHPAYAYSNYTTNQDTFYLARIDEYIGTGVPRS